MLSWRRHVRRFCAGLSVALLALMLGATLASAHEHREVGDYELTVGFLNEPAIVDEPNGLDLRVQLGAGDDGTPVEGLEDTLQAEVSYGGETMPLELRAAFGEPGSYVADMIPTETGAYTFRISGSIEGMEIDETFTSGPDTFAEVASRADLNFPQTTDAGAEAATTAADAQDTADMAQILAIVGTVIGVIGAALGVGGLLAARNARRPAEGRSAPEPAD